MTSDTVQYTRGSEW